MATLDDDLEAEAVVSLVGEAICCGCESESDEYEDDSTEGDATEFRTG